MSLDLFVLIIAGTVAATIVGYGLFLARPAVRSSGTLRLALIVLTAALASELLAAFAIFSTISGMGDISG